MGAVEIALIAFISAMAVLAVSSVITVLRLRRRSWSAPQPLDSIAFSAVFCDRWCPPALFKSRFSAPFPP